MSDADAAIARLYVDAAAVGVPVEAWQALPRHTREAIVAEHNDRIGPKS